MKELLPIIRRKRRPLLPVESVPDVVVTTEATAEKSLPPVMTEPVATNNEPEVNDAEIADSSAR